MTFRWNRLAVLAAAMLALPQAAATAGDTSTFELTLAGIKLGTVTLEAEQSGATYRAASKITPSAVVGAMTSYSFDGKATGAIAGDGRVLPSRFEAESVSPRAARKTVIDWRDGKPVQVSVTPQRKHPADPEAVRNGLDPVSAGFALLRDNRPDAICDTVLEIYDGSRRSRLKLGKPVASEAGYVCTGLYSRIEGEAHSLSSQKEYPFTLVFAPRGDGLVGLERIETQTRFGKAVVSRGG